MDILSWSIFGLIAGVIANVIDPSPAKGGVLGAVILGILGALVGGFLANLVLGGQYTTGFNFPSFIVAILGSLLLLFVAGALRRA